MIFPAPLPPTKLLNAVNVIFSVLRAKGASLPIARGVVAAHLVIHGLVKTRAEALAYVRANY